MDILDGLIATDQRIILFGDQFGAFFVGLLGPSLDFPASFLSAPLYLIWMSPSSFFHPFASGIIFLFFLFPMIPLPIDPKK
jgi:hypothetical protein